jgi:hypothetical protein
MLVFGLSPVVSLFVMFALAYCSVYLFFFVYEELGINMHVARFEPAASAVVPYIMSLLTIVLPTMVAGIFYCWLAKRFFIGGKWLLLACAMLAVLAAMPCCSVVLSDIPGHSALRWGVLNPQSVWDLFQVVPWIFCKPQQLMQFVIPLAVGLWFLRRKGNEVRLKSVV